MDRYWDHASVIEMSAISKYTKKKKERRRTRQDK